MRARLPVTFFLFWCIVMLGSVLVLNEGRFTYALDDAYIHLTLADEIARGHYGINANEFAAPASSILWPFLLAPFSRLPAAEYGPLVINLLLSCAIIIVVCRFVARTIGPRSPAKRLGRPIVVCLLVIAFNLVALTFGGMEHPLQLLVTAVACAGLVEYVEGGRVAGWWIAALIVGPFVRYENLAVTLPILGYLIWRRQYTPALVCAAVVGAGLGTFSWLLYRSGGTALPVSVLFKSDAAGRPFSLSIVVDNVRTNLGEPQALVLIALLAALLVAAAKGLRPAGERGIAAAAAAAIALHFAFGRFGWFARYEVYVWMFAVLSLLYLFRQAVRHFIDGEPRPVALAVATAGTLLLAWGYVYASVLTPIGCNNVFSQQYQMRRFAIEYLQAPVAVTDLGLVKFRNEQYVLDLNGLASPEVYWHRRNDPGWGWMERLAARSNARVAMIYTEAFPAIPPSWTLVARLHLGRPRLTVGRDHVEFYATDLRTVAPLTELVQRFRATLPKGVSLSIASPRVTLDEL